MSDLPFTLSQLKILHTISNEGSFKKAAEKLYISQPAVSLQIQNLEKQLNTPLFYREKRKARLTGAGKLLIKIRAICLVHENKSLQLVGRTNFVPNAMLKYV